MVGALIDYWVVNLLWEVGFALRDEQDEGTLEQLWLAPAPRWLIVVGNSAANTLVNSLMSAAILFQAHLWFGLSARVNWPLLVLVCLLSWLALYGLGFVYAGLVLLLKEAESLVRLGNDLAELVAGVTYPLAVLPVWLRGLGRLTPLAWALSVLRAVALEGKSWSALRWELTVLATLAVAMPAAGIALLNWLEGRTRRRGSLSAY